MTRAPLQTVTPGSDLSAALELMVNHRIHQLPVVGDGHAVGLVTRSEILGMLQVRDELHLHSLPSTGE